MAQFTARFIVVSKVAAGGQTDVVLRAKQAVDAGGTAIAENTMFRDKQPQTMELRMDTSVEKTVFTKGSDVLVTFVGPA